jgi:tRNA U34 5-methylaminomethyl-2-thiouridine-forming methyltransferase MnmC
VSAAHEEPAPRGTGRWEPVRTADGSYTVAHPAHGETCHSRHGAFEEARQRYALACGLAAWAGEHPGRPLRLLDVGTGLGWNLGAALEALGEAPLVATSLELDVRVIRLGGELLRAARARGEDVPPAFERAALALEAALAAAPDGKGGRGARCAPLGAGRLALFLGDARDTLRLVDGPFDAVFLDPFSRAREPELWEQGFLSGIAERMAPGSWLSTYSASFAVRCALARAGLFVGAGARVGSKAQGTLASPDRRPPPLDSRVSRRLERALSRGKSAKAPPPLD